MKNIGYSMFIFMFSIHLTLGQSSLVMQSNGLLETNIYQNQIVSFDDGFFVLFGSDDSKARLILSKYDGCNNHLWTKEYNSNFDLNLYDVLVHNEKLVILFVTHFNSSTTRTPILLRLDMDGEIEFANRYNKKKFDNFINLSLHNNQYHIMGPSTGSPDGGGHFVISEFGDLIYSDVITNVSNSSGTDFGCAVLKNGLVIRRFNNTLIACDNNQNIIWAKQFMDFNQLSLLESKPLALDDGFVQFLKQGGELVLFKMDYNGNIVWSISGEGRHFNTQPVINNNLIRFLWRSQNSEGAYVTSFTELEPMDGTIKLNKRIEYDDSNLISWPNISTNSAGDILISGSVDADVVKDFVFINPQLSECTIISESPSFTSTDLTVVDVANEYEIIPVSASQDEVSFTISEIEPILTTECARINNLEIDTSLDCSNSFIFNGNQYGSEFLWSDGKTDSLRTFKEPQEISLVVRDCDLEKQIHININESTCSCQISIPNVIWNRAQNSENQKMMIQSNCVLNNYSIQIFDRWGSLVFQSNDVQDSWTPGNSNNLNQGVYTWLMKWSSEASSDIQVDFGTITYLR